MSAIEIKKVASKADLTTFIDFHYSLYKGNAFDAPNLYRDELDTLSSNKNAAFDFCEAAYFLAYKEGLLVGRVAAIINYHANEKWHTKAVRFGWIDFIDDIEVSRALLKAVEDYGRSKGMDNVVGPLGFTDFDPEGMLIEGFDQLGTMATIYTKVAEMIENRYNLHVRAMTKKEVYQGGLGYKVFEIINETFKDLYGYSKLTEKQIYQYIDTYLPYGDLNWMPIVEDWNCEPHKIVGVGLTIPSLSRALQKLHNGRLLPFGWWHILKVLKFHQTNIVDLLLIGVLPEYRVKGANALLFSHLIPIYQKYGIAWGETHVEMETNEKVQNQWQYLETVLHKRRRCYRKDL